MTGIKVGDKVRLTGPRWRTGYPDAPEIVTVQSVEDGLIIGSHGVHDIGDNGELYSQSSEAPGHACELVLDDEPDPVNHPSHYTSDPSGVECITITRHRNFNVGNAIKYLWRAGLKDDPAQTAKAKRIEDLRKAVFYIEDEIKQLEGQYVEDQ